MLRDWENEHDEIQLVHAGHGALQSRKYLGMLSGASIRVRGLSSFPNVETDFRFGRRS